MNEKAKDLLLEVRDIKNVEKRISIRLFEREDIIVEKYYTGILIDLNSS
jgi:hypothetical protein